MQQVSVRVMMVLTLKFLLLLNTLQKFTNAYDFIIIGAGSAGSLLANRLSRNPHWQILLLEAGTIPPALSDIPASSGGLSFTEANWNYTYEPQTHFALGMEDQRLACPRGKALGGSSVINYMLHIRGNSQDLDKWASHGNEGWSYDEVLPYFRKYENYTVKLQDKMYHGKGGHLTVEDVAYRTKSSEVFVEAMKENGFDYVDFNGKNQIGVSYVHATTKRGIRASAYRAFLEPVMSRRNLHIRTEALVTEILTTPISKRAYGVNYIRDGTRYRSTARREVILSAGAINSPQILMLSGIGPEKDLNKLDIPVVHSLPVGRKMYDHLCFLGLTYTVNESITFSPDQFNEQALQELLTNGTGPFTSTGLVEAVAFIDTRAKSAIAPDIEFIFLGGSMHFDKGTVLRKQFRFTQKTYDSFWKQVEGQPSFTIIPILLQPKSFGYLKLRSKNPFDPPLIYGNYLTDAHNLDVRTLISSIRFIQKLTKMPTFRRYNTTLLSPIPTCKKYTFNSDQYWECGLRYLSSTLFHPSSTCKMGPKRDREAVVDEELQVHGIRRLRVVDASIFPAPTRGHNNAVVYMIAEKAADMIIKKYN